MANSISATSTITPQTAMQPIQQKPQDGAVKNAISFYVDNKHTINGFAKGGVVGTTVAFAAIGAGNVFGKKPAKASLKVGLPLALVCLAYNGVKGMLAQKKADHAEILQAQVNAQAGTKLDKKA